MKIDPDLKISEADVFAVRSCMTGTASADQQQRAMQWIAGSACALFEPEYEPGERPLASAHRSGRRYVGLLLSIMKEPAILEHAQKADKDALTKRRGTK